MDLKNVDRNKLASDLDVAYTTVQEWYMGTSYPRIDKISAIAKIRIICLNFTTNFPIEYLYIIYGIIPHFAIKC